MFGCSEEPSERDCSSEHPKHMLKLMDKKILTFIAQHFCLSRPMYNPFLVTAVSWLPVPLVKQVTGPRATTVNMIHTI